MAKTGLEYIQSPEKRRLDVFGGIVLGATTSPLMLAVALETVIEHRRLNPLFIDDRIGRDEAPYRNYKFQSLQVRDAAKKLIGGSNHPDASRAGKLIRKTALDELPQLFNVIKGDISLVGIRPVPQNFLEYFEMIASADLFNEWHAWYIQNPGLTGEGQLASNNYRDHSKDVLLSRMEIDIHACEHATLKRDLQTIGRTPVALFRTAISNKQ